MDEKQLSEIIDDISNKLLEKATQYFEEKEKDGELKLNDLEVNLNNIAVNLEAIVSANSKRVEGLQTEYLEILAEITKTKTEVRSLENELLKYLANMKIELTDMIKGNEKNIKKIARRTYGQNIGGTLSLLEIVRNLQSELKKQEKINKTLYKKSKYIEYKLKQKEKTEAVVYRHFKRFSKPFYAIFNIIYRSLAIKISLLIIALFGLAETTRTLELKDIIKFILEGIK